MGGYGRAGRGGAVRPNKETLAVAVLAPLAALAPLATGGAEATLWDLLIYADVTGNVAYGGPMTVAGSVANHAGWPVPGAAVTVRAGSEALEATSAPDGTFEVTMARVDMIPGLHSVQMRAGTDDGRLGMASIEVPVSGEVSASAHTARLLSSEHALRYLAADASDFEDDPIGAKMYEHYQGLQRRLLAERAAEVAMREKRAELEGVHASAEAHLAAELAREAHGDGTFGGYAREVRVDGLDREIRPAIVAQLDHTLEAYRAGKEAMQTVLNRGGTMAEAIAARNAVGAVPRSAMEALLPDAAFDIDDYPWADAHMRGPAAVSGAVAGEAAAGARHGNSTAAASNATSAAGATPGPSAVPAADAGQGVTTLYRAVGGELVWHVHNGTHWVPAG